MMCVRRKTPLKPPFGPFVKKGGVFKTPHAIGFLRTPPPLHLTPLFIHHILQRSTIAVLSRRLPLENTPLAPLTPLIPQGRGLVRHGMKSVHCGPCAACQLHALKPATTFLYTPEHVQKA